MSDNYKYNKAQHEYLLDIIEQVKQGAHPVIRINKHIFEDCVLQSPMMARLVSITHHCSDDIIDKNKDEVYIFTCDFSEFLSHNKQVATHDYYDEDDMPALNAWQAGAAPSNNKETVFHSISHGMIFFEVIDEGVNLYNEYRNSNSEQPYITWLENEVTSLRKEKATN